MVDCISKAFLRSIKIPQPNLPFSIVSFICSVICNKACTVELCFLKPNWFSNNNLFNSRNSYNLLRINFSVILSKTDNKEIDRKLLTFSVEPPWWMGITLTIFNVSGNLPVLKEVLIILQRGIIIKSDIS